MFFTVEANINRTFLNEMPDIVPVPAALLILFSFRSISSTSTGNQSLHIQHRCAHSLSYQRSTVTPRTFHQPLHLYSPPLDDQRYVNKRHNKWAIVGSLYYKQNKIIQDSESLNNKTRMLCPNNAEDSIPSS